MKDVIIIGAGLSGLICAQQLRHAGYNVTIVEKSAGVGGRMATRRVQGTWIDHGAQYIAVYSDGFERFIDKLREKSIVQLWTRKVYQLTPKGLKAPNADEMYPRYSCPQGMTAIAKYLATDLKIFLDARVVAVECKNNQWQLKTEKGEVLSADALVAALPAPQFLPLFEFVLAGEPSFLKAVRSVKFSPCIAVMAGYSAKIPVPPEWRTIDCIDLTILGRISWDSSKHPDSSKQPVFVFQSTAEFGWQSMEESNLELAGRPLLTEAGKHLTDWLSKPEWWQVHRWRYAFAEEALGVACLTTDTPLPLVCAGDWCAGANLEGAYQSGIAAAVSLIELLA